MSYATIPVKRVFEGVVRRRGIDPATAALSTAHKGRVADLVNRMLKAAWQFEWWPDLCVVEQRQYRESWASGTGYQIDDEVYREDSAGVGRYYVAVATSTGVDPALDSDESHWEVAGEGFEASIAKDQAWEDWEIGDIDARSHVFASDPRLYANTPPLQNVKILNGVIYLRGDDLPTRPWLKFRHKQPVFSWTDWNSVTAYGIGDRVFLDTYSGGAVGASFVAIAPSTNVNPYESDEHWQEQGFPEFLEDYVVEAVAAEDAQEDEARFRGRQEARRILEELHGALVIAQGDDEIEVRLGR
jgi:hypothetical protein